MTSVRFHVLLLVLGASTVMAAPKVCKIEASGELTNFNGDTYPVAIPCRYRLAKMTCGVDTVKVTVRSHLIPPANEHFSPEAVRVQISYRGNKYVADTSVNRLTQATDDTTGATSPWTVETFGLTPRFAGLEDGKATVKKGETTVTFSSDRTVEVTCNSGIFTGAPIDQALCGENQEGELQQWKNSLFGPSNSLTDGDAVRYLVLTGKDVVQSHICEDLVNTFQSCVYKEKVITSCVTTFGKYSVRHGDDTILTESYRQCTLFNCRRI